MFKDPFEIDFSKLPWLHSPIYKRNERQLFSKMTDCILQSDKELIVKKKYDKQSIKRILFDILNSNPLTFGLKRIHVSYTSKETIIEFEYYQEYDQWRRAVQNRTRELYESLSIKQCKTKLEIELVVNDWMCEKCTYCKEMDYHIRHSVLGVLLEGRGVCSSFALCTSLLLSCFGIECHTVSGKMKNSHDTETITGIKPSEFMDQLMELSEQKDYYDYTFKNPYEELGFEEYDDPNLIGHAWNYLILDGRERYLDVTFNNGNHKQSLGQTKHSFFNLTNKEIKEDRIILFGPGSVRK